MEYGEHYQAKPNVSCYFFHNVDLGGAHAKTCDYYQKLGYCPCIDCDKYISHKEVYSMVKNRVDARSKGASTT